jgi:hypothetical protein
MYSEFTFYDYIDADGCGENLIKSWLNGDGKPAHMGFTTMIGNLEASSPRGFKDSVWTYPYVIWMDEEWEGFIELRKEVRNVQYRLIGKVQDRHVFLVTWGIHKMQRYKTDASPQTASDRVNQMIRDPARYRRKHEA